MSSFISRSSTKKPAKILYVRKKKKIMFYRIPNFRKIPNDIKEDLNPKGLL